MSFRGNARSFAMIATQFRCLQCCLEFLMRVGGQLLAHAKRCALVTSFPSWQITVPGVIKFASLSTCCRQPLNLMHGILGRALMKARRSASNPIQSSPMFLGRPVFPSSPCSQGPDSAPVFAPLLCSIHLSVFHLGVTCYLVRLLVLNSGVTPCSIC